MGQTFSNSSSPKYAGIVDEDSSSCRLVPADSSAQIIQLSPVQSCNIHGWSNPKRTLSWSDVANNRRISFVLCIEQGISAEQLHEMQPDVNLWIRHKQVSFQEVPHMVAWPLHPIEDLKGDISDLATMRYDASVLRSLGLSYQFMRNELRRDDDWMRGLRYKPREWKEHLGFDERCAAEMGETRVAKVFGMDMGMLRIAMNV